MSATRFVFQGRRVRRLVGVMSRVTGYSREELTGAGRAANLAHARFAIVRAARKAGLSYLQIGRELGNRDHTTAMNADRRAAEICAVDPCFSTLCRMLESVR